MTLSLPLSPAPASPAIVFPAADNAGKKKPYQSPELIALGDIRDITLGPSPGLGESGNPAVFRS
jgi:hypothetical protein